MKAKKITDRHRLDWLTRKRAGVYKVDTDGSRWFCDSGKYNSRGSFIEEGNTPRAAIDAAIKKQSKQDN